MAKLKARNRTEIVRMEREDNAPKSEIIIWEKVTVAMMSDGKMLEKRDVRFPAGPYDNGKDRKHTYGWKVKGKLKADMTREKFIEIFSKRGYQVK